MMKKMTILTVALLTSLAAGAAAQTPSKPAAAARPAEAPRAAAPLDERNAGETKERLREIFQQYPPSVAQVLRIDPSLLTKPDYLAPYPTLANFLAQHPEVAHNPVFFLGTYGAPYSDSRSNVANAVENIF